MFLVGWAYYSAAMHTRPLDNRQALRIVNGYFGEFLSRIPDEGWELPTPCTEWNIRDLVQHVTRGHIALVRALHPDMSASEPAAAGSDDEVADTCRLWASKAQAAVEAPGVLERTAHHSSLGEMTGDSLTLIRWGDVCVHAWDLAQAIGADFTPDPELALAALEWLVPFSPGLSSTGHFAEVSDPGPNTAPFTRVLTITGRMTNAHRALG
ncbi:TIGR03086 family protein [Streptomyces sp. HG99]|nr:TIGR03086 family protein [Streptomyces sp. HG99]